MKIREVMTEKVEFLAPETTLQEAAVRMRELGCGFLAVDDGKAEKLIGVVTDRDLVIRATAEGLDPRTSQIGDLVTDRVLYCFADDDLEMASGSMREQGVYRLIVLDNPDSKKLCGVISLGDILRHGETKLAASTAEAITSKAA
ncbi:MAG: CBS domain-containing protein [Gammaproteobacteria bacterium]|nr:CBS domain-containing protein [Pseudomonadales bacterium]MCP5347845.1 CBS domain-containing protein [Pseudomonadales bacterium]